MYTNELRVEIRAPYTHRVKPLSRIKLISYYNGVSRNSVVVCSDVDQPWEREWRWARVKQTKRPRRPRMRVGNLWVRSLSPRSPGRTPLRRTTERLSDPERVRERERERERRVREREREGGFAKVWQTCKTTGDHSHHPRCHHRQSSVPGLTMTADDGGVYLRWR